ncbi:PaiB family negative transcriptional regulator [Antricoccus suffuscus]|uniref:PaiB family negative transcriptional regulator n=1 Tax=Antricoccus suffuscus TaxID=1629062 RepID=A0A2T0ZC05_9ACTN|nr:FMN-binding negative transcriptional regulator [Antricoccus suffuscus]PRZ33890.1 PaiB family negative transcriptional regulator [Antricoccus suffuscus]
MWINPAYSTEDHDGWAIVRANPLATIVTGMPLSATHMPLIRDETGALVGHIPLVDPISEQLRAGVEVLAIFRGPSSYISPSWYTEVGLPTYNYTVVHVRGTTVALDEAGLRAHMNALMQFHESTQKHGQCAPWTPDDAAKDRLEMLLPKIAGFRIDEATIESKRKLGQNRSEADARSVTTVLRKSGEQNDHAIADLMKDVWHLGNGAPQGHRG